MIVSSDAMGRFDQLSADYDLEIKSLPHYFAWQRSVGRIMRNFTRTQRQSYLFACEGGTGTGMTTEQALNVDPRMHIFSVDENPVMLQQALLRPRLQKELGKRLILEQNDIYNALLGAPANSADVFFSAGLIHNFPRELRREIFFLLSRIVKPGGLLAHGDTMGHRSYERHRIDFRALCKSTDYFTAVGRNDLTEQWLEHFHEDEEDRFTEKELESYCEEFGWKNLQRVFYVNTEKTYAARKM